MQEALFRSESASTRRLIYTASTFAVQSLIYLQEIGEVKVLMPHSSGRSDLSSFLFFFVEEGTGTLKYRQNEYSLKKGDCAFIDCKSPYVHSTGNNPWTIKWIHFYGNSMLNVYTKYLERGGEPVFTAQNPTTIASVWNQIFKSAGSEDYLRDMRINEGLASLLTLIMEHSWNPNRRHEGLKVRELSEIKQYLNDNFCQKITLDELAERFYINKYYLTRIFKDAYGTSIITYITSLRITKAKQLLRFSDLTIDVISEECGFESAYYFSKCFRKVEGLPPSEFRKNW